MRPHYSQESKEREQLIHKWGIALNVVIKRFLRNFLAMNVDVSVEYIKSRLSNPKQCNNSTKEEEAKNTNQSFTSSTVDNVQKTEDVHEKDTNLLLIH